MSFHRFLMFAFVDDFKAIRKTVWHLLNLTDGRQMFKPNLLQDRKVLQRVSQTGRSSHIQMCSETIESKFSLIQVEEISATVNSHEIFARTYRLYNSNLLLG